MAYQAESKTKDLIDRLGKVKDDLAKHFDELRIGKDVLLRIHGALDSAAADIGSATGRQAHDLNDALAAKPEDHPREQGQGERPPINTDENVNVATPAGDVELVVSGAKVDPEHPDDSKSSRK